jgi:hypothetical protein
MVTVEFPLSCVNAAGDAGRLIETTEDVVDHAPVHSDAMDSLFVIRGRSLYGGGANRREPVLDNVSFDALSRFDGGAFGRFCSYITFSHCHYSLLVAMVRRSAVFAPPLGATGSDMGLNTGHLPLRRRLDEIVDDLGRAVEIAVHAITEHCRDGVADIWRLVIDQVAQKGGCANGYPFPRILDQTDCRFETFTRPGIRAEALVLYT